MRNIETSTQSRTGTRERIGSNSVLSTILKAVAIAALLVVSGGCQKGCDKTGTYMCVRDDDKVETMLKGIRSGVKNCKTAVGKVDGASGDTFDQFKGDAEETCTDAGDRVLKAKKMIVAAHKASKGSKRIDACEKAQRWIGGRHAAVEAQQGILEGK